VDSSTTSITAGVSSFGPYLILLLLLLHFVAPVLLRLWAFAWLARGFHTSNWGDFLMAAIYWTIANHGSKERK
jgi:hypothetical protein